MRGHEVELAKTLGEACRGVRSHLGKQKRGRAGVSGPVRQVASFFHGLTITHGTGLQ
jgi:hypothetical protein